MRRDSAPSQSDRVGTLEDLAKRLTNRPVRRPFPVSYEDPDPSGKSFSMGVPCRFNYARERAFIEVETLWQVGFTGSKAPEILAEFVEGWTARLELLIREGLVTPEGYLSELAAARVWAAENALPEPRDFLGAKP